jgi:hypothetical protein
MGVFSVDVTHWNARPWIQMRTRSLICTSGTLMTMSQIVGVWAGTKVRGSIDSARSYHQEHRYSTLAAVPASPSPDISSIEASRFPIFKRHASPGAALMFTGGGSHGEAVGSYHGETLYHASLAPEEYRTLLKSNGFRGVAHLA